MATVIVLVNFVWSVAGFVLLWKCRKLIDLADVKEKTIAKQENRRNQESPEEKENVEIAGQEISNEDIKKIMAMIEGGK